MFEILKQTYFIVLPIVVTAFMGYIINQMQQQNKKRDANSEGTKLILFYMLERWHAEYMAQEFVSTQQRKQYEEAYCAYHNLGGNGNGTAMWEEIQELPVRNDKPTVNPYIKLLKKANREDK